LVYDFKFKSEYGNAQVLAQLLDETLPIFPDSTVIVPIPTIPKHIRQRGFGHTETIAKLLARKRKMKLLKNWLIRTDNSVQHGLKAKDRQKIAQKTFGIRPLGQPPSEILLIDDVYTTGATANAAAKLLQKAGVKTINLALIARHDKNSAKNDIM
jgi:ComF family protein